MNIKMKKVNFKAQVILFNDELQLVKILSKGKLQKEYKGKIVIPSYDKGKLINMPVKYKDGNYYKSYVIGLNKRVVNEGYVVDDITPEKALEELEGGSMSILPHGESDSDIIILFFD